jgi:hypothetical protein
MTSETSGEMAGSATTISTTAKRRLARLNFKVRFK